MQSCIGACDLALRHPVTLGAGCRHEWSVAEHPSALPATAQQALAPPADVSCAPVPVPPMTQPLTLVAMPLPGSPLPSVGQTGTFQVSGALGGGSVSISGTIANTPFVGVLSSPAAPPGPPSHAAPSQAPTVSGGRATDAPPEPAKTKRARACTSSATAESAEARAADGTDATEDERVALPDTVNSLLSRLTLGGDRAWLGASTQLTPGGRSAATWMELDAHKRSVVQSAVRADEERFRAEQALRDAQIAAEAARRRRREAMQAAEGTLLQVRCLAFASVSARGCPAVPHMCANGGHASECMSNSGAFTRACAVQSSVGLALHQAGRHLHGHRGSGSAGLPDLPVGSHPSSPSTRIGAGSACGHAGDTPRAAHAPPPLPFSAPMHAVHHAAFGSAARPPLPSQGSTVGARHDFMGLPPPPHSAACDDPLMTHIAHPGASGSLPGSLERDHYLHGAAFQMGSQAHVSVALRGPVASPNVNTRPLDPSRHNVYATHASDTPVTTRAWATNVADAAAAPHVAGASAELHAMDTVAPGAPPRCLLDARAYCCRDRA